MWPHTTLALASTTVEPLHTYTFRESLLWKYGEIVVLNQETLFQPIHHTFR